MSYWAQQSISNIYTGSAPNDGTGDAIRDAFNKVDLNFSNIATQLNQTNQDWYNGNVQYTLNAGNLNVGFTANIPTTIGGIANYSGNVVANIINSNSGIYNTGITNLIGNTYAGNISASTVTVTGNVDVFGNVVAHSSILPSQNLSYDLGSPTKFFRNIYVSTINQVNTVNISSDAGLFELHANLTPGDVKDVGVLGKYNHPSGNSYAFFGYQHSTDNFVYKQTPNDATLGNSVVWGGVYGNTQFGSQYLSNTTSATSTTTGALIVAGGVGVAGSIYANNIVSTYATVSNFSINTISSDLNVVGNVTSYGYPVITTNPTLGFGAIYNGTINTTFTGNTVFASNIYTYANVNVLGNVYGNIAGNINNQSTISATGIFGTGTFGSIYTTPGGTIYGNISGTYASVQNLTVSGALLGLTAFTATNINGTNLTATANVITGNVIASGNVTTNNLKVNGVTTVSGNIVPSANLTYNLGTNTAWWSGVYGTAIHAQYADLAEKYLADNDYPVGTVVTVGGDAEVTACQPGDLAIGAVSGKPAYTMNSELVGGTYIALKGRVPIFVKGAVKKGQRLVAGDNGCAYATSGETFAVALETNSDSGIKLVEAIIL